MIQQMDLNLKKKKKKISGCKISVGLKIPLNVASGS